MAFNPGDIVQLKSGGPKMTVDRIEPNGDYAHLRWFAGSKMEQARVQVSSLEIPPAVPVKS